MHPVGSIYTSTSDVNPSTLFGGTWEKVENDNLFNANDIEFPSRFTISSKTVNEFYVTSGVGNASWSEFVSYINTFINQYSSIQIMVSSNKKTTNDTFLLVNANTTIRFNTLYIFNKIETGCWIYNNLSLKDETLKITITRNQYKWKRTA